MLHNENIQFIVQDVYISHGLFPFMLLHVRQHIFQVAELV